MNEQMKEAWLEISRMLGEPTREELDVFLRTWQRAMEAKPAYRAVKTFHEGKPVYVAEQPAQRTWVSLTDEEIDLLINGRGDEDDEDYVEPTGDGFGLTDSDLVQLVRRSEAKLKEKNT